MIDPARLKQAIALRAGGYSLAAVSERSGVSSASLYRHFKAAEVKRGSLKALTVSQAKAQLLEDAGFINEARDAIASSLVDEMSLVRMIRESIALSLQELVEDTSTPASMKLRALASASTALSVSQTVSRKALNLDKIDPFMSPENLPELKIWKMSDADVLAMRAASDTEEDD
jgi:AcrR family transcriptional regulator